MEGLFEKNGFINVDVLEVFKAIGFSKVEFSSLPEEKREEIRTVVRKRGGFQYGVPFEQIQKRVKDECELWVKIS